MSGATKDRRIARKGTALDACDGLRPCAHCGRTTRGVGGTDKTAAPLCDCCYSDACDAESLGCPACGSLTGDGERCPECVAAFAEHWREAYELERAL
jgi:hypothetical protein